MQIGNVVIKPLISGVIAALGASMYFDDTSASISFLGMNVSGQLAIGVSVAVSDLASQSLSQWVFPLLPDAGSWNNAVTMALAPTLAGVTSVVVMGPLTETINSFQYPKIFLLSGASVALGDYASKNFINPALGY